MKKVFLIGDSIRIGYDQYVRELMQDAAQVYWSDDNARFVAYTYRMVPEWASNDCDPATIDIVHWNVGMWDALHYLGDDTQTTYEEYRNGLVRIIHRMKKVFPNAKFIFALTTSVIEERMGADFYRRNDEIEEFNRIACEIMKQESVAIDDLYSTARSMSDDYHSEDGTHFTEEGFRILAGAVVASITSELENG